MKRIKRRKIPAPIYVSPDGGETVYQQLPNGEKILKEEMFLKESMTGKKYIFHGLINKQMNKLRDVWIAVCHFVTMVAPWVI